jgi:XTP/dITP diphosphohydrolase
VSEEREEPLLDFVTDMRRLRAECPWKREQTHRSLARYLQEEAHETLEAIDTGSVDDLREELGDLLLQVYFHAVIAEEAGQFTLDDVAAGISAKMHRRNPHVFGDSPLPPDATANDVNDAWQAIKRAERLDKLDAPSSDPVDALPPTLPALLLADKVLDRLSRDGSPVDVSGSSDLGDRLLALVAEARVDGVDPEQALRDAVRRVVTASPPA